MSDEELRKRFRRDFQNEPTRNQRPAQQPTPPQHIQQAAPHHSTFTPPEIVAQPPARIANEALPPIADITKGHHKRPKNRKKSKKKIALRLLLVIIIASAVGGGYWYKTVKLALPIPAATRASVDYPLLYPTKLPDGFKIKPGSFSTSKNIVLYEAQGPNNQLIAFSVQQRPANFDFNKFYSQVLTGSTIFTTSVGQAAVGNSQGRLIGSLNTEQTWLLVTSTSKEVKAPDLKLILQNTKLAPVPRHP